MSRRLAPSFDPPGKTLALLVLADDGNLEHEAAQLLGGQSLRLHHSRIRSQPDITPDGLAEMARELPAAAALLPEYVDVVGYGCTSGATIIGPDRVAELVGSVLPGARVTDPLSAVKAAFKALGMRRIAYVSPYLASVTAPMRAHLAGAGIETVCEGSFGISADKTVRLISESSVKAGIAETVAGNAVDGVFVSCTNLRTFAIIDDVEAELGLPVVSSNQALIWHMLQLAGIVAITGPGRLFRL